MIRSELNFPCVEATRGFLTFKDKGLRLSCSPKGELFLTKNRRDWEEWYITIQEQHGLSVARLQSVKHGFFLEAQGGRGADDFLLSSPKVGTSENDSKDCRWLMEPHLGDASNSSISDRSNQFVLVSQFQQEVRLTTSTIKGGGTPNPSPKSSSSSSAGGGNPLERIFNFRFGDEARERKMEELELQEEIAFEDEPSALPGSANTAPLNHGMNSLEDQEESVDIGWEIEYTSGELCFISNPIIDRRIRCNVIGSLTLNEAWLGWELFRFIEANDEDGNLIISSWTHSDQFLSSDSDGNVFCTNNRLGHFEKWQVERGDCGVRLRSVAHQRYLSVEGEPSKATLVTTTRIDDPKIQWHLEAAHRNTYSIVSPRGLSVSCSKEGATVSKHPKAFGEWKIERSTENEGSFTLYNEKMDCHLGSTNSGKCTLSTKVGYWAIWDIEESPHVPGGIYITSGIHKRHLSCNEDGELTTSDEGDLNETWLLVPRLPFSLNGAQLAALGGAGAFSLMVTAAMPFAVAGLVRGAGFAATELGVAAGFSAEALMAGIGGGALLGAGVISTTAALVAKDDDLTNEVKEESTVHRCRPISAWRTWL